MSEVSMETSTEVLEGFPLSPQQRHLWRVRSTAPGAPPRVECVLSVDGPLDAERLERSLDAVVARHEILRTSFRTLPGMSLPLQVIGDGRARWSSDDLSGLDADGRDARLAEISRSLASSDGEAAAGLGAGLAALGPARHLLVLSLSALCADRTGLRNLVRELFAEYAGGGAVDEEPIQYADVSEVLNELLESEDTREGREHWRRQDFSALSEPQPAFGYPGERPEAPEPFDPDRVAVPVAAAAVSAVAGAARSRSLSASSFWLACWQTLIHRVTGTDEPLAGAVCDGRTYEGLDEALGPFCRTIPLRAAVDRGLPFEDLWSAAEASLEEARARQDYFTWEGVAAGSGEAVFVPAAFEVAARPEPPAVPGLSIAFEEERVEGDRFAVKLLCLEAADGSLCAELLYDRSALSRAAAERLASRLGALAASAAAAPAAPVGRLRWLGDDERRSLLDAPNDTAHEVPAVCLHELFQARCDADLGRISVEAGTERVTYGELEERANRLAHHLAALGAGPERVVGIFLERSVDLVAAVLAVLEAGAAYVPLDPAHPRERLAGMLADADVCAVVTVSGLAGALPEVEAPTVLLDAEAQAIAARPAERPAPATGPDGLAYVIYTSGSTGRPKGVMVSHAAIVNRLLWMQGSFPIGEDDAVLQKTAFSFDASIWELFVPLLSGARLVLARPGGEGDPAYLIEEVQRSGVTVLQLVPSMLRVVAGEPGFERCTGLRRLYCGGEALSADLRERCSEHLPETELHNLYGPTETAIDATHHLCRGSEGDDAVPIGRPLWNVAVYVLDGDLEPVPEGATGELYVGGAGLARGYLGRAALTAERFVPRPHGGRPGERLYRTGDLARWLPGGELEFAGRIDQQVKVRGYRIEPGEVEAVLLGHPAVREAAVVVREDRAGDRRLMAYAVPAADADAEMEEGGDDLHTLPDGLVVACLNRNEADLIHREIFVEDTYLRHGVSLPDGAVVFDVGANIGLFTLFVHGRAKDPRVFSFEPIPAVFEKLYANARLYGLPAELFDCGLSDAAGEAAFTFYPKWSGMSGRYADAAEDEAMTRAFLANQDRRLAEHADELLAGRFTGETVVCRLRTLSDVIRERGVERIDLLKIDVERSERDVLAGIADEDWPKIQQLVIEAHGDDDAMESLGGMLEARGFRVVTEDDGLLEGTGMFNLYAVRPEVEATAEDRATADAPGLVRRDASSAGLRDYLADWLPEYMLPAAVVTLPELPRTPGGKIDRALLATRDDGPARQGRESAPPRTPTEEVLAALWSQLLGVERPGGGDSFFELGGHSLLATQLVSRLRDVFGVELRLRTLFERPRLAELAAEVDTVRGGGAAEPPIEPVPAGERSGDLPVSFGQQRIWFLDRLEGDRSAYHLPVAVRLRGDLDRDALKRALTEIVRRHEALRTTFPEREGGPVQTIHDTVRLPFAVVDLREAAPEALEEKARRLAREEVRRTFDLATGPLVRALLLRLGEDDHVLVVTLHHIIGDGWSTGVLVSEVAALYEAFAVGRPSPLGELALQYADFAVWQRRWLSGGALAEQLGYWRERLAGMPPALALPTDRPRPAVQSFRGARLSFALPADLSADLAAFGATEGATRFMVLAAAYAALLHRYSGQTDFAVGTPIANRTRSELEPVIGLFLNTLVLRTEIDPGASFRELLERVRATAVGAYAHQDVPFEKVVDEVQPERDLSRTPLFQALFILQNTPSRPAELPGITLDRFALDGGVSKFDLTLEMFEDGDRLRGSIEYASDLFDRATVRRFAGHLRVLLAGLAADPDRAVGALPLLTAPERWQLVREWNDERTAPDEWEPIAERFARRAESMPEATALLVGEGRISYGELRRRAARVAGRLAALGIGRGARVALFLDRGPELVAGLLGILEAGAAYVPLDPSYPAARIAYVAEDAGVSAVVTRGALADRLPGATDVVVRIDEPGPEAAVERPAVAPGDLAYVIYTSGSTGRPKGVMVHQGAVANFFAGMDRRIGGDRAGVWMAVTSVSFDISVLELLWTLTRGYSVVVRGDDEPLVEVDEGSEAAPGAAAGTAPEPALRPLDFSLFYFADAASGEGRDRYRLLLEGARFADRHGFTAVWTPERHFHEFGGLYPNPSVVGAAVAAVTERVGVRAGSVVLPLHSPVRVAEEWSVVDNLSGGRVGISFASGWHADDFVLAPERFARRKELMIEGIDTVRRLWRGEPVTMTGGAGNPVDVRVLPSPLQAELPIWLTAAGNPETFRMAGELGAGVLTHLLGQGLDELREKIAVYREAWRAAGHGPGDGHVALMLHTFLGDDPEAVRETARGPFTAYLRSSLGLVANLARSMGHDLASGRLSDEDLEEVLAHAFDRYYTESGLFGTPRTARAMADRVRAAGVDEVACLIDFGIDADRTLAGLEHLDVLRRDVQAGPEAAAPERSGAGRSLVSAVRDLGVTHLQCTPSMMGLLTLDRSWTDLGSLDKLMLGGEAFPSSLAETLRAGLETEIHNMYGPTETTIWSATHRLDAAGGTVPIGRPIANTDLHVVDPGLAPQPVGVPGEVLIGGEGVVRGYHGRPALTAERFVPDPLGGRPGERLYRTGDLARRRPDGALEFLGRLDHQVKLHGHRIELGEIEVALARHPGVREAVVVARREGADETRLVAFHRPEPGAAPVATGALREHLAAELPPSMVPALFVPVDAFPTTPNGKIDRGRLAASELPGEAGERGGYEAPRTAEERALAEIWRRLLHRDRIGVHDNFFELGGDSIQSIQLIARAQKAGLRITPRLLFQHQTIAALAAVAGRLDEAVADQGPVTGPVPLLPIQRWFLDQDVPAPHHFNHAVLFQVEGRPDVDALERTVARLVEHHDALRLRFERHGGEWRQENAGPDVPTPCAAFDLSDLPAGERTAAQEAASARVQASLDLARGPLFRVAAFDRGPDEPWRLLVVAHHLVVDGISWRILLEDLQTGYEQARRGEEVALPPKTASFRSWAEAMVEHARSEAVRGSADAWPRPRRERVALPLDLPGGSNLEGTSVQVATALDEDETRELLQEAPAAYRARVEELLLTALARSCAAWTGRRELLVDLESHGREAEAADLDVSRTVGWFTSMHPVLLELPPDGDPGAAIRAVKERLRDVPGGPGQGLAYGLLRYLGDDSDLAEQLALAPAAELSFNYLGRLDAEGASGLAPAPEASGPWRDPSQPRAHLLDVNCGVAGGVFSATFKYSRGCFHDETIERLADGFGAALRELVRHCVEVGFGGFTPSDFPLARLDQRTLDALARSNPRIEDVYPLAPVQQALLFDSLQSEDPLAHRLQWTCVLEGALDADAFERAWQRIVDRHPSLRTAFVWEGIEEPLQTVSRGVEVAIEHLDWSGLGEAERAARTDAFLAGSWVELAFDRAPIMGLALIRLGEKEHRLVWRHHHLILDGWSTPVVIDEVLRVYAALSQGGTLALPPAPRYRDYVRWVGEQDLERAEAFWRRNLAGFDAATPLDLGPAPDGVAGRSEIEHGLDAGLADGLRTLARRSRVTLNTLLQAAWALVLSASSGRDEVLFGAVSSGRPPAVAGIDAMAGVFISNLPMRVGVPPSAHLVPWLRELQGHQQEVLQFEYAPLAQVQRWSDVPDGRPLFESVLVFENFPLDGAGSGGPGGLRIRDVRSFVGETFFPLVLTVVPGAEISLHVQYDAERFEGAAAADLAAEVATVLRAFVTRPESALGELVEALREHGRTRRAERERAAAEGERQTLRKARRRAVAPPGEEGA